MNSSLQTITKFLTEAKCPYEVDEEALIVHFIYTGTNAEFNCAAKVSKEDSIFQMYTFIPDKVQPHRKLDAAEICIRASCGLNVGHFHFDIDAGNIWFQASAPYLPGTLSVPIVRFLVGVSMIEADNFYPTLKKVLSGEAEPKIAIEAFIRLHRKDGTAKQL